MKTIIDITSQNNAKIEPDIDLQIPLREILKNPDVNIYQDKIIKKRIVTVCVLLLFISIVAPVIVFGFILWFH